MGVLESGLATQLCFIDESAYGAAPSLTGAKFYDFLSETLELKKKSVQGKGIHAGKLHGRAARRVITGWDVTGGVEMELPAQSLNAMLYRMFGSYGQTNAALTEDSSTGAYKGIHYPGPLEGHSFTAQKGVPSVDGTTEPVTEVGLKILDWTVSVQKDEIAKLSLTMNGRNELAGTGNGDPLNGSVPSLLSYSGQPGSVFHFAQGSVYTGGTPSTTSNVTTVSSPVLAGNLLSAEVKYTIPMDTENRYFLGNAGFKKEPLQNDLRTITGQFVIEWLASEAMYDAYAADTATTFELQFVGPGIGTGSDYSTLAILIPNIHLEGETPKVGGPEIVKQTVPFTGLDDDTNNPIQATYWTVDTT
jgi:hypothetical protein